MNTRVLTLAAVLLASYVAKAEDLNLKEKPDTVQATLSPLSFGFGLGAISALNTELSDRSPAFLKISLSPTFEVNDHFIAGLDLDWMLPGQNFGAEMSLDYLPVTGAFRPFIGVGGGMRYFDKLGSDFGHDFGPSGTAHVGMLLDIMDELQLRLRVPFYVVGNTAGDRAVGFDASLLFSSPLRTTHVKKLKY